jgi:hypothetical protein
VPRNSSSKSIHNPQFDQDLATIRAYWRHSRVASGQYQNPVS